MWWLIRDFLFITALCALCRPTDVAGQPASPTTTAPAFEVGATQRPSAGSRNDTVGSDILKQVLSKKCLHHYTMTCLKLDLVRLIDRLGTARAYQLVPGISIVRSTDANQTNGHQTHYHHHQLIPPEVIRSLVRGNESNEELDGFLMEKVDGYLNTLSISVKLVDSSVIDNIRKLSSQVLVNILPSNLLQTGRGKKHGMHAALWSAGTLAAIGFAALAAMSGKALMTAMLALVLAAICALRGHGGGGGGGGSGKTSHYEIITKPAIYDHDHLVHGASYSSAPYSYARHLNMDDGSGGRSVGAPQHISVVHADSAGPIQPLQDNEDSPQQSYPLSPITYIPTNNT